MFFPEKRVGKVTGISVDYLKSLGIQGLILDIDNTLTTHDNPVPSQGVADWLENIRKNDIKMIVLSNNNGPRVKPFAEILGLDYLADGKKPLKSGFIRCSDKLGLPKEKLCIIGDQIFTDILGGNYYGCHSILVNPIQAEKTAFFKFKRFLERIILFFYNEKGR